jgi:hypothetical protein
MISSIGGGMEKSCTIPEGERFRATPIAALMAPKTALRLRSLYIRKLQGSWNPANGVK